MFTSSIKREIRTFHVVVVRRRKRNVQKKCTARAKLLFCQIYIFLSFSFSSPSPSSLFKLPNTKLQTDRRLLRPRLYGEILSWVEVSLVCPSYSLPPPLPQLWASKLFFISVQNLANCLHEKHKVGWAKRVACHPFFNGRVTLLAGLTWLDINILACPVRSTNNNNNNNNDNNNNNNNNSVIYSQQYL